MNERKKMDLTGILYDENGLFIPLTDVNGNTSEELSHLRNTYMVSEREYFECLLADDNFRSMFSELLTNNADILFEYATEIQWKLETGDLETEQDRNKMELMSQQQRDKYHMEILEKAEGLMCLLFAAAKDKDKMLELVRTRSR